MDIEAIRKRSREKRYRMPEKLAIDLLLGRINDLEEKLRWKKVTEEKPPLDKSILIRNGDDDLMTIGMLRQYTDTKNYYWNTDIEYRNFDYYRFNEWREI